MVSQLTAWVLERMALKVGTAGVIFEFIHPWSLGPVNTYSTRAQLGHIACGITTESLAYWLSPSFMSLKSIGVQSPTITLLLYIDGPPLLTSIENLAAPLFSLKNE
ncbi:hypothetical protein SAMN05216308_103110 [Nitrosospira sp. Nsp13]|jgi:hypothetical protein|nr:hypothetical protein SAMN05216308_103110 [Nitrosospira sp. Nsp13]